MKLGKIFAVEIAVIVAVVVLFLVLVEVTPYLASSKQKETIEVYNQRTFVTDKVALARGESGSAQFNYSTYDPAILVIDLAFENWQTPGSLAIYCNGRSIAVIQATPENPNVHFTTISVSGWDWVKPPSPDSYTYGNEITFVSEIGDGFEGIFGYHISIRGSR